MTIAEYTQNFDMKMLTMRKKNLTSTQTSLEKELADLNRDHSDVTAAMALKSYNLKPGDVIQIGSGSRLRIEAESMEGKPIGQPITHSGQDSGRTKLLHDFVLSQSRKVV